MSAAAQPSTRSAHQAARAALPPDDGLDEAEARRGFIATIPNAEVRDAKGRVVWTMAGYEFLLDREPPDTIHPALWRQARLNTIHGLFRVTERIYQVRGLDVSNMTIVEGEHGLIVIDPVTCTETAAACLKLYREHRPARPVVAVIYSHSHLDHFGGVKGVVDEDDVRAGRVEVVAPAGFMEAAVAENLLVGTALGRRVQFQIGHTLARGARCQVDGGLGKSMPAGTYSLIAPTRLIEREQETHVIDGVEIVFQLAPDTEAPAEMHFHFPGLRALNLAENACRTLHNLCPIRGAKVRDARKWSHALNVALTRYAPGADVVFAQHHWPTWGNERLTRFLRQQRDLYKFIHDQTVRLINHGWNAAEIAESFRLPPGLEREWHVRGYYGTLSHNVKAVYQHYMSWYDGNPSNLHALPPEPAGRKYLEYMGGAGAALERARADFARGEYRWVAQVMNHVVFADSSNREARELGADALEQMAYQAESATWRNAFLLGARELREGVKPAPAGRRGGDVLRAMTEEMFFDDLAVRVNPQKADGLSLRLNWIVEDADRCHVLELEHCTLTATPARPDPAAGATVRMTRATLDAVLCRETDFPAAIAAGRVRVEGDAAVFDALLATLDGFRPTFNVVEP